MNCFFACYSCEKLLLLRVHQSSQSNIFFYLSPFSFIYTTICNQILCAVFLPTIVKNCYCVLNVVFKFQNSVKMSHQYSPISKHPHKMKYGLFFSCFCCPKVMAVECSLHSPDTRYLLKSHCIFTIYTPICNKIRVFCFPALPTSCYCVLNVVFKTQKYVLFAHNCFP